MEKRKEFWRALPFVMALLLLTLVPMQSASALFGKSKEEVKAADGTVMTPGKPHQFASYVGYPYLMVPGTYTWSIQPSEARLPQAPPCGAPPRPRS